MTECVFCDGVGGRPDKPCDECGGLGAVEHLRRVVMDYAPDDCPEGCACSAAAARRFLCTCTPYPYGDGPEEDCIGHGRGTS